MKLHLLGDCAIETLYFLKHTQCSCTFANTYTHINTCTQYTHDILQLKHTRQAPSLRELYVLGSLSLLGAPLGGAWCSSNQPLLLGDDALPPDLLQQLQLRRAAQELGAAADQGVCVRVHTCLCRVQYASAAASSRIIKRSMRVCCVSSVSVCACTLCSRSCSSFWHGFELLRDNCAFPGDLLCCVVWRSGAIHILSCWNTLMFLSKARPFG
jgi:hypothetical protein